MKIAVCGKRDEVSKWKKRLQEYFQSLKERVEIDTYTNQEVLMEQLQQYDSICMTEDAIDLITRTYTDEVMFEWGKKIRTCNVKDVYYAEADLKNVHIWLQNNQMLIHLPFSRVEQILSVGNFIKVHRSYLVNCQYIKSIDEHSVILKDGRTIPLSKYRSEDVRKQFAEYIKSKSVKDYIEDEEE